METTEATARKAVWISVPIFWVLLTAAPLLDVDSWRGDFLSFYFAFKAAWWGGDFYDVRVLNRLARAGGVVDRVWPYLYPPLLAQMGAPLGLVPLATAQFGWLVTSVALFAVVTAKTILWVGSSFAGERGFPLASLILGLLLFVLLPVGDNFQNGQVNFLVLAFVTFSILLHARGNADLASGALLGAAALIKATPAILVLFLLLRGRFRAVLGFLAGIVGLSALSMLVGGIEPWRHYLEILPSLSHGQTIAGHMSPANLSNFSIAGFYARLWDPLEAERVLVYSTLTILLLLGVVALEIFRARHEADSHLMLLPLLAVMIVASPLTFLHHVVYLFPGALYSLFFVWRSYPGRERWPVAGGILLLVGLSSFDFESRYGALGLPNEVASLNLFALFALYVVGIALHRARAPRGGEAAGHRRPRLGR